MHYLTCTVVQRTDVFTRSTCIEIIEDSLDFCINKKGLIVFGYVIVPNHIHLPLQAKNNNLSDALRHFKKVTSGQIKDAIDTNDKESRKCPLMWLLTSEKAMDEKEASCQFWQPDNHPAICFRLLFMWQKLNYIHNNLMRVGIVNKAEKYKHGSAADYFMESRWGE